MSATAPIPALRRGEALPGGGHEVSLQALAGGFGRPIDPAEHAFGERDVNLDRPARGLDVDQGDERALGIGTERRIGTPLGIPFADPDLADRALLP